MAMPVNRIRFRTAEAMAINVLIKSQAGTAERVPITCARQLLVKAVITFIMILVRLIPTPIVALMATNAKLANPVRIRRANARVDI